MSHTNYVPGNINTNTNDTLQVQLCC